MSAAPTILRTKSKLSDYLEIQDKTRFKVSKKSSRPWIINTASEQNRLKDVIEEKLVTDFETLVTLNKNGNQNVISVKSEDNGHGYCTNLNSNKYDLDNNRHYQQQDERMDLNFNDEEYKRNQNMSPCPSQTSWTSDKVSNEQHSFVKSKRRSPNSQRKFTKQYKKNVTKNNLVPEDDETDEDREKQQRLARDLEMEYQEQVNRMFNNRQAANFLHHQPQYNQLNYCQDLHDGNPFPPLYIMGPQGLYYVMVPPPPSASPDTLGSVGELSETEGSEDSDSIKDVCEEAFVDNRDLDWVNQYHMPTRDECYFEQDTALNRLVDTPDPDWTHQYQMPIREEEYCLQQDVELNRCVNIPAPARTHPHQIQIRDEEYCVEQDMELNRLVDSIIDE